MPTNTTEPASFGLDLEVRPGTPVEDADQIAVAAQEAIHRVVAGAYCVIHVDPAAQHPVGAHQT